MKLKGSIDGVPVYEYEKDDIRSGIVDIPTWLFCIILIFELALLGSFVYLCLMRW